MSSAQPPAFPHLILDNTLGAAFIGVILAAILYGVSCVQAWYYFTHQNDGLPTKLLVLTVIICDTLHQALISHAVYKPLITNYGNLVLLQELVWSDLVGVTITGLTAMLVQSYMTYRIWNLSHRSVLVGIILILILGGFACSLIFTVKSLRLHIFSELVHIKALSILVNAIPAVCDVLITVTLCALLHKSRSGFHRSNVMINKLILFAINTGCFTSLCAVASVIANVASDGTYIYIAFYFCIGRLYTNSLLATLNGRDMIRGAAVQTHSGDVFLHDVSKSKQPANISINIDTQKEFSADGDSVRGLHTTKQATMSPSGYDKNV